MPTLYIVATPIGNLEDITLRALRILKEVDVILCEDTRVSKKLMNHYGIQTQLMSYHANSTQSKEDEIIALLHKGTVCALISDAGTPCISDPGTHLTARLYKEVPDIRIVAVPGASALIAALSISGISLAEFTFLGFIPQKKGRQTFFENLKEHTSPVAFYESPHRILKTLESLVEYLEEHHTVIIAREITKIHEEVVRGTAQEIVTYFEDYPDHVRGEFVVIVCP